jgi:zinc protease
MRGVCLRAVIVAVLVLIAPSGADAQRSTIGRLLRDTVLANGLHVIVLPIHTIPVATIEVVVRNGAYTQLDPADEGIPHLLEHMLFKSFGGGPGSDFGTRAAELHAGYNGTTSDESVTYYLTLPSRNAPRGIQLLAELMREPRFRQEELVTERRVVQGELERNAANPNFVLGVLLNRLLWGPAAGRKEAAGNVLSVLGADADRLRRYYERYYVPNNSAVVITGDVEPAEAFAHAARHFDRWKRGADPFEDRPIPAIPALARDTVAVVVDGESSDITVSLRWQGPSVGAHEDETYAADVFSALVNQPHSGMQKRLVETGLFQSVWVSYATLDHVGPVMLSARTTPEKVVPAMLALRSELSRFDDPEYFSEEELRIAAKQLQVEAALELEGGSMLAHTIGFWWSVAGLDYYLGYVDALGARTPDDLRRYVERYIVGKPKVVGMLVSEATRTSYETQLAESMTQWFWP